MNRTAVNKEIILLYDMDGTIIDNNNAIIRSWKAAQQIMKQQYHDFPTIQDHEVMELMGQPGPDVVKNLNIPTKYQKETLDAFRKHIISKYPENKLYPEVEKTLNEINEQGIKLALITGARRESALELLQQFSLTHFFSAIIGGDSTERGKPHPDPVILALKKLDSHHHDPDRVFFIGDSINDIKAAKAANIKSVFYCPISEDFNEDLSRQADFTIRNHPDILDIIKL